MINYYEVLEVSEKASDEIIEKAYKVLAKKYHPDLQQEGNKKEAEEKMKLVNEAYEILSNKEKREKYDEQLYNQRQSDNIKKQEHQNVNNSYENRKYSQEQGNTNNNYQSQKYYQEEIRRQQEYRDELEREARRRYAEAYNNYLRSLGYKIKYRWTWNRVKTLLITIVVVIGIVAALWFIPPSREYMIKLYEENFVIKMIVDIIISLINSFIAIFKK